MGHVMAVMHPTERKGALKAAVISHCDRERDRTGSLKDIARRRPVIGTHTRPTVPSPGDQARLDPCGLFRCRRC
ncbi:MAG: hypothetical protein RLY86_1247 [Pseudomonadota bacterium]|jgi:hypothetical protein